MFRPMRMLLDVLNMDNWNTSDLKEEMENFECNENNKKETVSKMEKCNIAPSVCNLSKEQIIYESVCLKEEHNQTYEENDDCIETNIKEKYFEEKMQNKEIQKENISYKSSKIIIKGCHLYFIEIAREIIESNNINLVPLMREYNLKEQELQNIFVELINAGIIDKEHNILLTLEEFEKLIDIYEPNLFECKNTVFDKEIFICVGEIIYQDGIDKVYDSLKPDEIIDYLNIMEKMKILQYDNFSNTYIKLCSYDDFIQITKNIPSSYSSEKIVKEDNIILDIENPEMTGIKFEVFSSQLLLKNGFTNVKTTPKSGDHGIDILAEKDDITYAIQCKFYSGNVGNSAIQQAHTGKSLYKCDVAVVMTNSSFTSQAIEEAKFLNVKLWDGKKIKLMQ